MEQLIDYGSDDDSGDGSSTSVENAMIASSSVRSAPTVFISRPQQTNSLAVTRSNRSNNNQLEFRSNPKIDVLLAPVQGPSHPFKWNSVANENRIESTSIEDWAFDEQYQLFQRKGFAIDSSNNAVLGDIENDAPILKKNKAKEPKRKRDHSSDLGDAEMGPWAPDPSIKTEKCAESVGIKVDSTTTESDTLIQANLPRTFIVEPEEDDEKWEKLDERKMSFVLPPRPGRGSTTVEAKTVFHGKEERDYQGRSWILPPPGMRAQVECEHECFIPKKCTKKLTGHTKGVQAIEFFPGTGHLLLSASMDGKCKIWDVVGDKNVRRTYSGHSEAVRSIHMSNSGLEFLSSSFDRYIRLWDVETGQAKGTFSNRKMGYQVKFYPNDANIFLVAASDNKIYQWDARTGGVCQEYNYHLQPCNTITFFDEGRKFVSTSDDKKILVWEYDIPVPINYIQDPSMHSVPSVSVHPSGAFFAGQSLDNTIVTYACGTKVKQLKKKTFSGHNNSGYACQIGFSPNGKFMISGDGLGKLYAWDWKSTKLYRKLQVHENGPCMGAIWHPLNPSCIATCGWDGLIKLWD